MLIYDLSIVRYDDDDDDVDNDVDDVFKSTSAFAMLFRVKQVP